MRRAVLGIILLLAAAVWSPLARAQAEDPRTLLDLLRTFALEARLEIQLPEGSSTPELFTQGFPDGRTWMQFIADTIGTAAGGDPTQPGAANQWAMLDEAVSITLAEAERMKALAAAAAGTPDEAKFQRARKNYLAGAARLLNYYKVAAGDVFDSTAGVQPDPAGLPDWLLPGEIRIKEVAGAARLNTESGEFSGQLSGRLELPGFGSTLVISDASFGSDGSFDLSAYGDLTFNGGQLSIPPRKPAHVSFRPGRGVSFEGDARLSLSNGLRFDASMSLRDPEYCFSLAARGMEFELGRQLMLRRIVIQDQALENLGSEALYALGEYYLSLNGAAETLLTAATNFPPISETQFGQPPEFSAPEIQFDFSTLNAWSAEIIANTRAGLSNAQQSIQPVLDALQRLNQQARDATNALTDERGRLDNLAARLDLRWQMNNAADVAAAQQLHSVAVTDQLNEMLVAGLHEEGALVVKLITPDLFDRLDESLEVVRLLLGVEAGLQGQDANSTPGTGLPADPCAACTNNAASYVQRAEALTLCAARRQVARYGMNPISGTVTNATVFNGLSEFELYRTGRLLADIAAELQGQGATMSEFTGLIEPLLNRQRELLLTEIAETNTPLARSFEIIHLLTDNVADSDQANITLDNDAIVTQVTTAMSNRFVRLTNDVGVAQGSAAIGAAKEAAAKALVPRLLQVRSDVQLIMGRHRTNGVVRPGDHYRPDVLTQWIQFFSILNRPVPPVIGDTMDAYVRFKVAELRAEPFTVEFLTNRLNDALGIASMVIGLTDWADLRLTNDFAFLDDLKFSITNFSHSFSSVAEAQRAWWLLDRYQEAFRKHTEVYGERLNAGLRLAEQQSHARSLAASMRVGGAFSNLLANIVVRDDVIVPLPGKVEVTRIFGKLCFNRVTGFMQGCFGGRLEFPEVATNAFFEINNACLDTLGNYLITASTALPLSFGRSELEATVSVTGTPAGVATFTGAGTLSVSNGLAGAQVLNVNLSYDQPQRRLSFDALGNNLDMRIADDFVIFDAGFGFDLSLASPEGTYRASGSAGLLARQRPLPASLDRTNFHLVVDGVTTVFSYSANAFAVSLSNGTLRLPDIFHNGLCTNAGQSTGPQAGLAPGSAITVNVGAGGNPSLHFSGALDFRNLGFNVPGLTNLGIEVCSARLLFRENGLPCFTNLNATLSIPLPQQTVLMDVNNVAWCIDGFPDAANISLRQPIRMFDVGGIAFEFQTNTTFGFTTGVSAGDANGQAAKGMGPDGRSTTFTMAGGLRGLFDATKLADAETGSGFTFDTSGTFSWTTGELPQIGLGNVTFAGRMKLGGSTGFELLGVDTNGIPDPSPQSVASITLTGLTNLFALSTNRPFDVQINGAMGSSDFVFFGLGDAKFRFDGLAPEPEFSVASLGFRAGDQLELLQQQALPFRVTAGSIAFINPNLPLNLLFAPENLRFTLSGEIDISLAPPDSNSSDIPRLFGALDNVQVSLPNGFGGAPQFSVNTFTLFLENLTIGDMAGLSGGLTVGNLNNPAELFFAGTVGGGYNGVGIKAIVAIRLDGLIGACLAVDAGPAGIPLDGGALGGILLTGAEGGVSLLNQFADPCDFKSFLNLSSGGTPAGAPAAAQGEAKNFNGPRVSQLQVVTWAELERFQKLHQQQMALRKAGLATSLQTIPPGAPTKGAGAEVPCPTGDCPPATLNLLCQRHPSVGEAPSGANYNSRYAERVIFKFSSLDRATVDDVLATANINLNGSASVVAGSFANATRDLINGLIPRPPANMPADQRQQINQFIDNSLAAMRNAVATAAQTALEAAAGQGRTPLEALYEAAYAGVKCVDITIQLKGTFSYAPISLALTADGGAVASTTGSAGVLGAVNLFGLPVGTGEFFYSLTDTNGNFNPSLCGGAHVALGPLEFGNLGLAMGCDDCITGELDALAQFINGLSGQVLADASPLIYSFVENAAGHRISNIRSQPLTAFFGQPGSALLTAEEQVAVLTALLNLPKVAAFLNENPGAISEFGNDAVRALGTRVVQLSLNLYHALNPRLQFCGEVEPKVFGFSLTGGNTLVAARAYADKTNLRGDLTFSPSYVFGNLPFYLLSGGLVNNVVPALDEATMGMSLGLPSINDTTVHQLVTNPVQYATGQLNHLLDSSTVTFGYELSPFGFKLADGEGRISLPTLANHPDNPARRSARPQDYNASGQFVPPSLPDRSAVLKAALDSNELARATWTGKGNDLVSLFPSGSAQAQAVAGRELVRDYFPHGGFLGAARVQLPKPITDAPPLDDLAKLFAPPTNILQQLTIAQQVFENYVLGSREVGHLMTYVPFPKPPPAFWNVPQSPQALIDSISDVTVDTLVAQGLGLYPAEQFFMSGGINAQFLGLPIGQGTLAADPAAGLFRLSAGVPADSWMKSFFDAQMVFEIKRADYIAQSAPQGSVGTNVALLPDTRLQAAFDQLLTAAQPGASPEQRQQAVNTAVERITDTLPKVSLDLALNNFGIPPALTNILRANAAARIVAYSPRFEPNFVGVGPVADARRTGGIAFKGRFNFASYVEIDNAELGVALRGTGLPALSGVFDVPTLSVPGLALRSAHFEFNSEPAIGGAYIAARGGVDPIAFINPLNSQPLLTVRNLTNSAALISANFDLRRAANGAPLPGFAISPSRIDIPMLGPGVTVRMHGATTNQPFAFSSTGPWAAQVSVSGFISVRDPLNAANEIARIGSAGAQFSASIGGTGMQFDLLAINLPANITIVAFPGTASQQTFTLGSGGVDNRLRIARDGTFILEGGIGGDLPLNGLNGFGSISGGASFRLSNSGLTVTINGNLAGGALNTLSNVNLASLSGQFSAMRNGVSLSGTATMAPMQFGVFLVSGVAGGNITALLTNTGFSIPAGARLRLIADGYPTNDLFTLNTFVIAGNGDFNVSATSGALNIPGYFSTTGGTFTLLRSSGVASLDIFSPTLRLFPQKPFETPITAPFQHVFMDSTGRFYADTSNRVINLPAGFVARGRLEIGYEPDPNQPGLGVRATPISFGTVNYGSSANVLLNITNTGAAPLVATLSSSSPAFTVSPANINLDPDDVQPVSVRFTPAVAGAANATVSLFHNAGSPVNISLTGTGRAVPIMTLSAPSLNFGDVKLNRHGAIGLRVDNVGIANLLITNRALSGPFTITPANAVVLPGSNVILNVRFSATAIANFNSTLQITSNDPNGTRNLPLTGAGFVIRWVDQRDGIEKFNAIAMNGGTRGFAVGDPSTVLFTDNGGHSWKVPDTKLSGLFRGAAMATDGVTGWITAGSSIYRTSDGGRTWLKITDSDVNHTKHFWNSVAEIGASGRVVAGGSVARIVTNQTSFGELTMYTSEPIVAVQRTSSTASFVTNVLGEQGFGIRSISAVASAAVGSQLVVLAGMGSGSGVFRSANGGTNWSLINFAGSNPGSHRVTGLAINSSGVSLLTTDSGEIYRSINSGSTWTRVFTAGIRLNAVAMDGVNARAVGSKGAVLQSVNSGSTWTLDTTVESTANLHAVSARGNNAWFAGDSGEIQFRPSAPPTGSYLVYQPGSLDYGFVPFQDSAPKAVTLLNRGISNLVVSSISLQGSASQFVVTGPFPVTIPPEGSHQVNVFFNPSVASVINTAAIVQSSDPAGSFSIPVRARSSVSGWVMKAPLPGGGTAVDVHLPTSTVGYAATSSDVFKSTNGGVTWQALNVPASTAIRTLHFTDENIGYIGGGNFPVTDKDGTVITPGTSFIMRTLNGGASWSTVSSSTTRMPVMNVNMVNDVTGFAITARKSTSPTVNGVFLRTTNGTSWAAATAPSTTFSGVALDAVGTTEVFASSGSVLFRSADAGSTWAPVMTNSAAIRDVHFSFSQFGRVVGDNGSIRRTASGGDTPGEWSTIGSFTADDLNRIHFVGIENTGWATPTASASSAAIYRSDDSGSNWREELSESPYAGPDSLIPTVVFGRTGTNGVAVGTGGSVRRYEKFTNEFIGVTIAQPVLLFTNSVMGFAQTNVLQVRNLGDSTLTISNLLLDGISRTNEGFRVVNAVPISVPVNGTVNLAVVAESTVAGTNSAVLSIITDGALQTLAVELRAVAARRPEVVTFRTDPPGLALRIDGANLTSPASFTLGDVNGPGQWATGGTHAVEAAVSNVVAGQIFSFAGWQPAGERVFSYGATNGSETFTARYLPAGEAIVPGVLVAESKAKSAGLPPAPRGPFLRLTGASLSNSVFGAFQVEGSLILNAERIEAMLASRSVRLPQSASQPALFQMSAGSWRFLLSTNVVLLQAFAPSLQVLSNTVAPPAVLTLNLNLMNANFTSAFSLPEGAVIARDLLEVGPSAASLAFSNFFSLSVTGEVRALRKPDQNDWAFKSSLNLQLRDGPFTNSFTLPASVMRLTVPGTSSEFFEARGVSAGRFELRRNSTGVFSLFVTNLAVDLLNQHVGTFSGLASAAGVLSLNAAPPASPFELGPFRWHATENSSFTWNIRNGDLRFTIGSGTLKDVGTSVPGWPDGGLNFPAVSFDSRGDFDHTITLPSFSFGGISLGEAEEADDRYVRFRRQNGVLSLKLRDQHQFFDSSMSVGFDISGNGGASGFFSGRLAVDFGGALGTVNFGRVDLEYDSTPSVAGYQFSGRLRAGGNDFRVRYGSAGGQACHLVCGDNGCSSTVCLSIGPGTGTFAVNPAAANVAVREQLIYSFDWTVPEPLNWHDLSNLQFRIRDEKNIVLWVAFNEVDRTFSVYNKARRGFGPAYAAGSKKRIATPFAVLDLAQSSVVAAGPTSPTVTLNLALFFKASATRHTYIVEVAARDKLGNQDDFQTAGTLTVRARR